jgi:hypothetical protein
MLICRPTLGFRGTAQQNFDLSPLDHGCPTCGLAVCIARPPATFVNYVCLIKFTH